MALFLFCPAALVIFLFITLRVTSEVLHLNQAVHFVNLLYISVSLSVSP